MYSLFIIVSFIFIFDQTSSVRIYEQCAGEGYGNFPCDAGLTCFRRNKWFSSCQFSCPLGLGWECELGYQSSLIAPAWDTCGGEGYVSKSCEPGFACYARTIYYSQCRPIGDCPVGWRCREYPIVPTVVPTVPPTVTPGHYIIPANAQCNLPAYANGAGVCIAGTACFRVTETVAMCTNTCPVGWYCDGETLGAAAQCGGEGYVGLQKCAAPLKCYLMQNGLYGHCAAACPGVNWHC